MKIADLAKRMIELSGLQVDKDIEIKYTGLRPGEKLYEELLNNKENTKETPHEKIRVAAVRKYIYKDVVEHINVLTELSLRVQILLMVKEMKAFVPEFKSQNSRFEGWIELIRHLILSINYPYRIRSFSETIRIIIVVMFEIYHSIIRTMKLHSSSAWDFIGIFFKKNL